MGVEWLGISGSGNVAATKKTITSHESEKAS